MTPTDVDMSISDEPPQSFDNGISGECSGMQREPQKEQEPGARPCDPAYCQIPVGPFIGCEEQPYIQALEAGAVPIFRDIFDCWKQSYI